MLIRRSIYVLQKYGLVCVLASAIFSQAQAQEIKKLTLKQAVELGLQNSHQLKLSKSRIDAAVSRYNEAKDKSLPTGSVGLTYNHAEIPTQVFKFNGSIHLPARADAYLGTFSLQEVIFAGNKLRYAKESTNLLTDIARLDADRDQDEIAYNVIQACFNLYKLNQSKKVVVQNLQDLDKQIKQAQQFFAQGIVTKNDVLRFQLQRSNIELTGLDLETNSKIVNYNLGILLGLPENTSVVIDEDLAATHPADPLTEYLNSALQNRPELKTFALQEKVAQNQVKTIQADLKPMFLVGANAYYINPSLNILPEANRFLGPLSLAATLSCTFDRLWTNKNKI
ncbi:MAG TPA: TolC family protein, partial [Daejeonella sp.]|nr:TolC family protein [Daejeonella sp.]